MASPKIFDQLQACNCLLQAYNDQLQTCNCLLQSYIDQLHTYNCISLKFYSILKSISIYCKWMLTNIISINIFPRYVWINDDVQIFTVEYYRLWQRCNCIRSNLFYQILVSYFSNNTRTTSLIVIINWNSIIWFTTSLNSLHTCELFIISCMIVNAVINAWWIHWNYSVIFITIYD